MDCTLLYVVVLATRISSCTRFRHQLTPITKVTVAFFHAHTHTTSGPVHFCRPSVRTAFGGPPLCPLAAPTLIVAPQLPQQRHLFTVWPRSLLPVCFERLPLWVIHAALFVVVACSSSSFYFFFINFRAHLFNFFLT